MECFFICLNFFPFFYCCAITVVFISPPYSSPALPTPGCFCPWVFYTCSLTTLPLLCSVIPLPLPLRSLSFCYLFPCLWFYFARLFILLIGCDLIGEIIWYLSFTVWLTSLSIILSSSIHAVAKGRSCFFLSAG